MGGGGDPGKKRVIVRCCRQEGRDCVYPGASQVGWVWRGPDSNNHVSTSFLLPPLPLEAIIQSISHKPSVSRGRVANAAAAVAAAGFAVRGR